MTLPSRHDELLAAHHAVHQAAIVTRAAQKALTLEQRISKADDSPVTIADFAAQAVVKRELRRRLPALAPVLAEEHADCSEGDPALTRHQGQLDAAARALGLSRKGLYLKRQRYGL